MFRPEAPDAQREQELMLLMEQNKTRLMRMAYMYLGDQAMAEEAVQDTFLKAYAHLDRFRGDSRPETWLTRIAINTCKDMRRTAWFRNRRNTAALDAVPERGTEDAYPDRTVPFRPGRVIIADQPGRDPDERTQAALSRGRLRAFPERAPPAKRPRFRRKAPPVMP